MPFDRLYFTAVAAIAGAPPPSPSLRQAGTSRAPPGSLLPPAPASRMSQARSATKPGLAGVDFAGDKSGFRAGIERISGVNFVHFTREKGLRRVNFVNFAREKGRRRVHFVHFARAGAAGAGRATGLGADRRERGRGLRR